MSLFAEQAISLPLTGGRYGQLTFWPNWLSVEQADDYLQQALSTIDWQSDTLFIAGKLIPIPRLHRWYSEPAIAYTWSGIKMQATPFPPGIAQLRSQLERETGIDFNSCLANHYRSGADSVDWHADDEEILGPEPIVASISLGAERTFQLRHCQTRQRFDLQLPHGSLLIMGRGIQGCWQHKIPKTKNLRQSRVNFTFRHTVGYDSCKRKQSALSSAGKSAQL